MDHSVQTVLITGASSGIGAAFAREVARRGSDLVLVARRADRLEALATEFRSAYDTRVEVLAVDLGRPGAVDAVVADIERRGIAFTALVNNAGFGDHGLVHEQDRARLREMLDLNVAALVELTRAFLPDLREGAGYLINVASLAAYQPVPRLAVYAATKAFVLSFTEALWQESRDCDLRVLCLSPGLTSTEFLDVAGAGAAGGTTRMQTPQQVVATALLALERPSTPSVVSGRLNWISTTLTRYVSRRTAVQAVSRLTSTSAH